MRKSLSFIAAFAASVAVARETVVIVPAHPDDLIASIGFCLLAREKFEVHVVDINLKGTVPISFEGDCPHFVSGQTAVIDRVNDLWQSRLSETRRGRP